MMRLKAAAGLLAMTLALGACSVLPKTDALGVYQFPQPASNSAQSGPRLPLALRINTPYAGYALSGPRIMVMTADQRLLSYQGVRWSDPVPLLLREYLAVNFQRSNRLASVTTDEQSLYADVHLGTTLRRFQLVDGNPSEVVIEVDARLVNPESRRVYVTRNFVVRQPVTSTQIDAVVAAYGQAAEALTAELLPWAMQQLTVIPQK